ncbi:MAG: 30S ribosomal protein S17 [Chlamydiia bacterium]
MLERNKRRALRGVVVGNKMDKTVVVMVERRERHPEYDKVVVRKRKLFAHVEGEQPEVGSQVTVMETRPFSKLKRWRVVGQAG